MKFLSKVGRSHISTIMGGEIELRLDAKCLLRWGEGGEVRYGVEG